MLPEEYYIFFQWQIDICQGSHGNIQAVQTSSYTHHFLLLHSGVRAFPLASLLAGAPLGLKLTHKDSEGFCNKGNLQGRIQLMASLQNLEALFKEKNLKITCFCQFYTNVSLCEYAGRAPPKALQESASEIVCSLSFINFLKNQTLRF